MRALAATRSGKDKQRLASFLHEVERGNDDANPYHNRVHVASVLHKMHTLLERTDLAARVAATLKASGGDTEPLVRLARMCM